MSCTLLTVSYINEIQKLENLLQDLSSEQQDIVDKGFGGDFDFDEGGNNWGDGWEDTDEWSTEVEEKPIASTTKPWLQSCKISLSPSEELVVLAKDEKGIFLSRKWPKSSSDETPFYEISWTGQLSIEETEVITCILAVPLASQQRSSQFSPDWTCVIAGFSSGYLRIYTNSGTQLLSQFLHDGPVLNIKIKTKSFFQPDQVEEVIILYQKAIVIIDGFSLYQSLRACRNQLAKSQASFSSEAIEPPPLAYRKWRTDNQKIVSDCIGCGVITPCFFDRLKTACVTDGPRAKVKGSTPAFNSFVTTGTDPFLCVYQALEGSNQPILSDVALAYASKFTSAVFSKITSAKGWFGVGSQSQASTTPDPKQQVERGNALPARFGLFDQRRLTERIQISPIGNLAVMTDQFNRVLLVNTATGVIIRIWKGYRDAECGWIVVEEEEDESINNEKRPRKRALFIVIYAPKRGILEIYLTEHGSRVGAFNVGKNCRLLCPPYQSIGQLTVANPMGYNCKGTNQCFLLQADGVIKSIHVPFHCALSNVHSIRVKDMHQLKKISTMIEKNKKMKNPDETIKELTAIFLDIQAPSTQRKAINTIVNSAGVSAAFLKDCLEKICNGLKKESMNAEGESEDLEYQSEREDLVQFCVAQQHLIDLYVSLERLRREKDGPDGDIATVTPVERSQAIADLLHITLTEANNFLDAIDKYKTTCLDTPYKHPVRVTEKDIDITTFLSCFNTKKSDHDKHKRKETSSSSATSFQIEIDMSSLSKEMSLSLGCFFFEDALNGRTSTCKLTFILETSRIPPYQTMMLLTTYTQSVLINKALMKDSAIYHLHSLISSICSIKGLCSCVAKSLLLGGAEKDTADLPVGDVSLWWKGVRDILAQSILIGQSLIMAIVCRSVAMEVMAAIQKVKTKDENDDIVEGGWEAITIDMEEWNLLVCQLENLIDIDCFIHSNHSKSLLSGVQSPTLKNHIHSAEKKRSRNNKTDDSPKKDPDTSKMSDRLAMLSVKAVVDNGPDLIAQLIADCLVRQGVPGYCLGTKKPKKNLKFRGRRSTVSSDHEMSVDEAEDDIPDTEDPNLSSYDTLLALVELRKKFPYSLEQDMVWVHCVWESIMVWNEDTEDLSMLRSALIHLSCIHNTKVQCGLGVMMWKAVFKEIVKSTLELMTKIGKAPKDRLCKKNVSLSYKALEEFLDVGKKLLEMLNDVDVDQDSPNIEVNTEDIWKQLSTTSNQRSIVLQASEEFTCNNVLVDHYWCLVTSLHLVMLGNMRSVKPRALFDTKGRHAFTLPLHATPVLSTELDDVIMKARQHFCNNAVQSVIKLHIDLTFQDELARNNTSDLLHHLNAILSLASAFKIDEEALKRFIACELYAVGLDIAAQEIAMTIEDKETFSSQMIDVIGGRLVKSLLVGETAKFSETISKLPTNISSWLTKLETSKMNVVELPITKTYHLLQYLNSNLTTQSKDAKFIKELIECLKVFL